MTAVPLPEDRPTLTVEEAGALLGISRASAYVEAKRYVDSGGTEGLPVISFGRRRLVPTAELRRLLRLDPPLTTDHPPGREATGPKAGLSVVTPIGSSTPGRSSA